MGAQDTRAPREAEAVPEREAASGPVSSALASADGFTVPAAAPVTPASASAAEGCAPQPAAAEDAAPQPSATPHAPQDPAREAERWVNPARSLFEATDASLAGVHRGSALSLVTGAVSGLGVALGVSLVALVRMVGGDTPEDLPGILAIAAVLIAVSVGGSVVSWRTRTWELTDAGLILRTGVLNTKELQVPYEHIHTVNMSSSLVERVLGLMTLDVDTGAADSEGEATRITGLQAGLAQALREELFRRKALVTAGDGAGESQVPAAGAPGAATAAPGTDAARGTAAAAPGATTPSDADPDARFTLTTGQVVLAALTETRVAAQAAAFLILIVQGLNFLQESRLLNLSDVAGDVAALPVALLVGAAVLLLAFSLVIGFAASFAISLIGFAGYRAERRGPRLSVERGLLSRTSHTVALDRIQSICLRQGLIRQLMGYAEVRAAVVGSIGSADETSTSDGVVLHPFLRLTEVDAFLAAMAPEFAWPRLGQVASGLRAEGPAAPHLAALPPAAARRLAWRTVAKILLLVAVLAGAGVLAGHLLPAPPPWDAALLVLRVLLSIVGVAIVARMVLHAVLRYRDSRIGHDRTRLLLVTGGVKRWTEVVPRSRLQHATAATTPFQRRLHLATFSTRTAAASDLALRDLTATDAEALLAWVRPHGSALAPAPPTQEPAGTISTPA